VPLRAQWSVDGSRLNSRRANASSLERFILSGQAVLAERALLQFENGNFPDLGVVQAPAFQNSISGFDPQFTCAFGSGSFHLRRKVRPSTVNGSLPRRLAPQ
jgi:hypothetical protein